MIALVLELCEVEIALGESTGQNRGGTVVKDHEYEGWVREEQSVPMELELEAQEASFDEKCGQKTCLRQAEVKVSVVSKLWMWVRG